MDLPVVSLERVDVVENDGGSGGPYVSFRVNLSKASDDEITLDYRTLPGTAVSEDFDRSIGAGILPIPAGETSGLITLRINGDDLNEVDESFFLEVFNPQGAVLAGGGTSLRAIGIIRDDDGSGSDLSLFVGDAVITEGASGTKLATFEVHLSQPHSGALSFDYKTVSGSAAAGSDFVAKAGTVKFAAGQTVAAVQVQINGDRIAEASEFFSLVVTPKTEIKNGTQASTGVATILDDDTGGGALPVVSLERVDVVENDGGSGGPYVSFRVNLSKASDDEITLDYRTLPGTAVLEDFDRSIGTGVLPIPAGETSGLITLRINGDDLNEVDESFFLEVFNPQGAVLAGGGTSLRAIGIIRDDDGSGSDLSLFVGDAVITEGASGTKLATFEVHLSQPHSSALSFDYKTVSGSAAAGSDFVAKAGTVKFAAGQTVAAVQVQIKGDGVLEGDEQFSVVLTPTFEIKNGKLASTGIATIVNDDTINEIIYGTAKADRLDGGLGADRMSGLEGNDVYFVDNIRDKAVEAAGGGTDTVYSSVSFTLGTHVETLRLTGGDAINGAGNAGVNTLFGNTAANTLAGLAGNDILSGGAGNDRFLGGAGMDFLTGGRGNDRFEFNLTSHSGVTSTTRDHIMDFAKGDHIDISSIDANTNSAGNQAFVLDKGGAFSVGEIRQTVSGKHVLITFNTDFDAAAEMSVLLINHAKLGAGDFYL